jgi:thiamine transporter ThiT
MRQAMRGVLGLVGLFNMLIGFVFLLSPVKLGVQFALSPIGTQGLFKPSNIKVSKLAYHV